MMCYFWRNMCTNQDNINIPFIMRGNHFLVHRYKNVLTIITCIFHILKYVVKCFKGQPFYITFLCWDFCLNHILRSVLFNQTFCALAPLTQQQPQFQNLIAATQLYMYYRKTTNRFYQHEKRNNITETIMICWAKNIIYAINCINCNVTL